MLRPLCLLVFTLFFAAQCRSQGLSVQPQTCVVDSNGICQVSMQLVYESDAAQAICFVISEQSERWCYHAASRHELTLALTTRKALRIDVLDPKNGHILANGVLLLAEFIPSNSRKRRRFSWSFQ